MLQKAETIWTVGSIQKSEMHKRTYFIYKDMQPACEISAVSHDWPAWKPALVEMAMSDAVELC